MELLNRKWDEDDFFNLREEVLGQWPTGAQVDFQDGVSYHQSLPESKQVARMLSKANEEGRTLIQPRAGVALLEAHIDLLKYLQNEGEADILPTTIDSYTRQNQYEEAQRGIEESRLQGRSLLNGFPAVNHGVDGCRKVIEALERPLQVRHGTPDARLLAEITVSAGFTDFEGGGISYNIPYAKKVSLEKTLQNWQYVDRLIGLYAQEGVLINREPFGPLTGTLVPPAISHTIGILEALLAAEQGVKAITLGYGQCGNLHQDLAALHTLKELGEEYLEQAGYGDVQLTTVFHQWMGGFPQDEAKAFGVIAWGTVAAAMGDATKIIVKTPHEAMGIPTKEANAQGLRITRQMLYMLRDQKLDGMEKLDREKEWIRAEVQDIMAGVQKLGEGDLLQGVIRSFQAGVLDIPFAPSRYNKGLTLPARDDEGAVRYLETGKLPLRDEIKAIHEERLAQRGRTEGRTPSFQMVIDDIYAIGKGMLVGRPR